MAHLGYCTTQKVDHGLMDIGIASTQTIGKKRPSIFSVPNLFQKLEPKNLKHTGIILIQEVIERQYYDRLYENQNNLNHPLWQEFSDIYQIKFKFVEHMEKIAQGNTTCIWFFKERPQMKRGEKKYKNLEVDGHDIEYQPNTILITNKKIKFYENKPVLRRPCLQIDLESAEIGTRKNIKHMLNRIL